MHNHQFEFTGNTKEYFGIWITNVLLTIITFGVYGAWAKVRDKKYMYGNTMLDGHSFDYHATGKQIFIGRLIVVGFLLGMSILNVINLILYFIGLLVLICFLPALLARAIRFNARMSSYRNVRFDFTGTAGQAFKTYILIPIGNVFTLYLCSPFVSRANHYFLTNNAQYGDRPMQFGADIGKYYKPFLIAIALGIAGFILFAIFAGGMFASLSGISSELQGASEAEINAAILPIIMAIYAFLLLIFVPIGLLYRAWIRNIHFNNSVIDGIHHLQSSLHPGRFIWIVITNTIVSLLTLGLMIPWGRIRLARYMASITALNSNGALDGYTSSVQESAGVISAEYADLEGFDIDIGV